MQACTAGLSGPVLSFTSRFTRGFSDKNRDDFAHTSSSARMPPHVVVGTKRLKLRPWQRFEPQPLRERQLLVWQPPQVQNLTLEVRDAQQERRLRTHVSSLRPQQLRV